MRQAQRKAINRLVFMLLMCVIAFASPLSAIDLPGLGSFERSFHDEKNLVHESPTENSRAENPFRKGSQYKYPWKADSLWDQETVVWDPFDTGPQNWPTPEPWTNPPRLWGLPYGYPDRPPLIHYGCAMYCDNFVAATPTNPCPLELIFQLGILHGVIDSWEISGNFTSNEVRYDASISPLPYMWVMTESAKPEMESGGGGRVTVGVHSKVLKNTDNPDGFCECTTVYNCEAELDPTECECIPGQEPELLLSIDPVEETLDAPGSMEAWVTRDALAGYWSSCPPYEWTIVSTEGRTDVYFEDNGLMTITDDYNIEEDYSHTIIAGAAACGTYRITVTDACGEWSDAYVMMTNGVWTAWNFLSQLSKANYCGAPCAGRNPCCKAGAGTEYTLGHEYVSGANAPVGTKYRFFASTAAGGNCGCFVGMHLWSGLCGWNSGCGGLVLNLPTSWNAPSGVCKVTCWDSQWECP